MSKSSAEVKLMREMAMSLNRLYPWANRNSHVALKYCSDEFVSNKERLNHQKMMKQAKRTLEKFCKWQDKQ